MIKCCGKLRDSRFCPDCGKMLVEDGPLWGLLQYLRLNEGKAATRLEGMKESGRSEFEIGPLEKTLSKWKAWVDALSEVLERQSGDG